MNDLQGSKKIKGLSDDEVKEIVSQAIVTINNSCKLAKIDFFKLDKKIRNAMFNVYQNAIFDFMNYIDNHK